MYIVEENENEPQTSKSSLLTPIKPKSRSAKSSDTPKIVKKTITKKTPVKIINKKLSESSKELPKNSTRIKNKSLQSI